MKNNPLRLLLVLAILFPPDLRADPLADARARYADGEYEQAAKLFEKSLESLPPQASVFFEFARCLRQTGQEARAAWNFRRALVLDPRFAPARAALIETNTDLGLPKPGKTWRDQVLERIPMDSLTLAGAVFFWLGAFAVTLLVFLRPPSAKGRFALGILCLAGGAAALALAWSCDPRITDRNTALVLTAGGASLLSSPADQSEKIAAMPDGSTVTILSQRGRWFYGRLPDGKRGWFLTEGIVPLIPPALGNQIPPPFAWQSQTHNRRSHLGIKGSSLRGSAARPGRTSTRISASRPSVLPWHTIPS